MLKNVSDLTSEDFSKGLNTIPNILKVGKDQTPNCMDVVINFDGSVQKRFGSTTTNSVQLGAITAATFSPDLSASLTGNLISFWKLDESTGQRRDSLSGNHLTSINAVLSTAGIIKNAANFIASSVQYLHIVNTASLQTGDINFSMSSWFYLKSTGEFTILSKRDTILATGGIDTATKLMLHMDGSDEGTSFIDSEDSAKTVTANSGAKTKTDQFKFPTASGYFDGSSAFLSVADSTDWDFGTGDFTIDFWARMSSITNERVFCDVGDSQTNGVMIRFDEGPPKELIVEIDDDNHHTSWSPSVNTWYHIEVARSGTSCYTFISGSQNSATFSENANITGSTDGVRIGRKHGAGDYFHGWIDEFRISKGIARHTSNFVPRGSAYVNSTNITDYEYWLYVNTDNVVTFRVSSSGTVANGTVRATSFGAVSTGTWYNAIAWHDTGDTIGVSVNLSATTAAYTSGVRAGTAPFIIGALSDGTALMNGFVDETGFWKKVLSASDRLYLFNSGIANTFTPGDSGSNWGMFDFGASNLRWLTVAAGTGVFASSNLGISFVAISTDRTATYNNFERSKNVLVQTTDNYDRPLYWTGSVGTFSVMLNASAPLSKFAVNFQGFLILLNSNSRKRSFFYEDENSQLTGDWGDSFDLPSSADDEITGAFVLRTRLYVSTRYQIFRLTFVGGNPDWSFRSVKSFGFVPRTYKNITVKDVGEVVVGQSWDRRIRFFDGADDKIASDNVEEDNNMCDFAIKKISFSGSGLQTNFAVVDDNEQVYKLVTAIGSESTQTTHTLNMDGRTLSFYPFQNTPFQSMCMAESNNQRFLMACDRSGYVHFVDRGNLDVGRTPINDIFDSSLIYDKSPSQVSKSHRMDLFFSITSSGTLYINERIDFSKTWKLNKRINMVLDDNKFIKKESLDVRQVSNVYQYQITSSANTADPWEFSRTDYFSQGLGIGNNP